MFPWHKIFQTKKLMFNQNLAINRKAHISLIQHSGGAHIPFLGPLIQVDKGQGPGYEAHAP